MSDKTILNIGKLFFRVSFLFGNICLFGYILTKHIDFAIYGYLLLVFGTVTNLAAILILVIYGTIEKNKPDICLKAIKIILINIPVAILYAMIGMNLVKF
ncbi:hypothetical protein ACM39_09220 [Chryseobacterium sp. FH2]|uniref:hypothetical protein n=1 Tax=Chryseobacterium sp. FH2 TaxID=1674291 RepID=UPI00065ABC68|nr:hypothetical protein [Chryseobacterium sp. FH2]KMQ68271.1 hypothetical protein ACM39_09220 [Chryseobacterium sp. FH2]